jgi:hypothetical protein
MKVRADASARSGIEARCILWALEVVVAFVPDFLLIRKLANVDGKAAFRSSEGVIAGRRTNQRSIVALESIAFVSQARSSKTLA